MQKIEFTDSKSLFLRAVKGASGYSNFSLLDELGNIFFHFSVRWDKGEMFSNTKLNGSWGNETRVLRKLGDETSIVVRQAASGPPKITVADKTRVLKPAGTLLPDTQFDPSCSMDFQGDFEFVSLLDTSGFAQSEFFKAPQKYAVINVSGHSRIVDRKLLGGKNATDDQFLCEAIEAAISASELPKVKRAALGTASLAFAAELLSKNRVSEHIELYGRSSSGMLNTLKTNHISQDGIELFDVSDFKTKALTAGLVAGTEICSFLPEDTSDTTIFSVEDRPLPLANLEKRIAANQHLHLRSRTGGWIFDHPDPQELGGLDCALDVCIAAYNSEEYLEECVTSILDTDCQSINAVVVSDGSTDGTEALAQKLAKQDDRVRLITKPNGGCASARNYGRLFSNASHIAFVDADDFVDPGFFEHLFNLALNSGYEIVQAGFMNFDHQTRVSTPDVGQRLLDDLNTIPFGDLSVRQVSSATLMMGQPAIWRRVYRRDFLDAKKITFPENVRAFDDYLFQMRTLNASGDVLHIDGLFYRYRQHENQDIRKADARHFYELYMFRQLIKVALEEGWSNFSPVLHSMINSINWTVSKLQHDLVGKFLDAAAEVVVTSEKAFPDKMLNKPVVDMIHHPDFAQFYSQWERKLAALPSGYWAGLVSYAPEHPLLIDWN